MYKQHLWTSTVNLGKMPRKVERTEWGMEDKNKRKKNKNSHFFFISVVSLYPKFFISISVGYITSYRWATSFFLHSVAAQHSFCFQMSLITNNEDTKIFVNIFFFFFFSFFWDRDLEMGLQPRFRTLQGFWEQGLLSGALRENVTHLHFHQVLGVKNLDYPRGPVVKSLPANAGDSGSIPSLGGSHMPHSEQLTHALQLLSLCPRACAPQEKPLQLENSPLLLPTRESRWAATKTQCSQKWYVTVNYNFKSLQCC